MNRERFKINQDFNEYPNMVTNDLGIVNYDDIDYLVSSFKQEKRILLNNSISVSIKNRSLILGYNYIADLSQGAAIIDYTNGLSDRGCEYWLEFFQTFSNNENYYKMVRFFIEKVIEKDYNIDNSVNELLSKFDSNDYETFINILYMDFPYLDHNKRDMGIYRNDYFCGLFTSFLFYSNHVIKEPIKFDIIKLMKLINEKDIN